MIAIWGRLCSPEGVNKPKQKVWYVGKTILETAIKRGCEKRCFKILNKILEK